MRKRKTRKGNPITPSPSPNPLLEEEILENYGGFISNNLETIFANIDDNEATTATPLNQFSTFLNPFDADIENFLKQNENNFTVYSLNANSLHQKHTHLAIFVEKLLPKKPYFFSYLYSRS